MATSGTVGTTIFNTRKVIDHAYRGCRLSPQRITGEMIEVAKDRLYLLLSAMANEGCPLWCIEKVIRPFYQGVYTVPMPVGTIDVLNPNIREVSRLTGTYTASEGTAANAFDGDVDTACVQTTQGGNIAMLLESETLITTFGLLPGATGTWNISLQYSDDNVAWTTLETYAAYAAEDMVWQWYDFEGVQPHLAYRLLANGSTILDVRELVWAYNPSEIPMARLNKDDYYNLPNKFFLGRPLQFWYDRQRSIQNMLVWPAPDNASQFRQMTALIHRHIMDVGTLQQEIEVPQRWLEAIIWRLANELAAITPEVDLKMVDLTEARSMKAMKLAWAEEVDNSPMYLAPNISLYTR